MLDNDIFLFSPSRMIFSPLYISLSFTLFQHFILLESSISLGYCMRMRLISSYLFHHLYIVCSSLFQPFSYDLILSIDYGYNAIQLYCVYLRATQTFFSTALLILIFSILIGHYSLLRTGSRAARPLGMNNLQSSFRCSTFFCNDIKTSHLSSILNCM